MDRECHLRDCKERTTDAYDVPVTVSDADGELHEALAEVYLCDDHADV